ncbi:hypothetical protein FI667_g14708, partial [Globisporangium splendens]
MLRLALLIVFGALAALSAMAHSSTYEAPHDKARLLEATATTSAATVVPFATMETAGDALLHILAFLIILAAAHPLGMLFPRLFRLPLITGYLIVGILTGPFVANLLRTDLVDMLSKSVNAMALSFISFQAGQEIYLPELRPQIRGILQLLMVLYTTAMTILTLVLWLGAGPFFYGMFDSSCKLAIALLFGSIAVLGSPATVMAIKIELDSNGPFTNLMLGATMMAEFVVLISFSVSRVVASVYCAKLDVSFANLMFTMGIVLSNLLVGAFIGLLILAIFLLPGPSAHGHDHDGEHSQATAMSERDTAILGSSTINGIKPPEHHQHHEATKSSSSFFSSLYFKGFWWLFMGYVFYVGTSTISELTIAHYGHSWDVKFEPLLVLMVASCIAGHHVGIRHEMHVILDAAAPFVFLPFFVMTGAGLKLDQVADAIPLMSLFVGLRYIAIFLACYTTGRFLLKLPPTQYNNLWLTMTPQAGVALGLANEVKGLSTDPWAAEFAATIVAAVVVNQIIGPVLCAMGLSRAGESRVAGGQLDTEMETGDGNDPGRGSLAGDMRGSMLKAHPSMFKVTSAIVVGNDGAACEIALQLALYGAQVKLPLLSDDKAARWNLVVKAIHESKKNGGLNSTRGGNFVELQELMVDNGATKSEQHEHDEGAAIRRTLADATSSSGGTDAIFFTGDENRTLEHVKMLAATTTTAKMPRLVAVLEDMRCVNELRRLGVLTVQSALALANIATRVGLSDNASASQVCADSCPSDAVSSASFLLENAAGASAMPRVIRDRRRVLQRNVRQILSSQGVGSFQQHDGLREALGMAQLPMSGNVAPTRLSMFGRSNGPEYFLGSGMRTYRPSNLASDIYIMDGGVNGEGGYEPGSPTDSDFATIELHSNRSAKAVYSSTNLTPGKAKGNSRR